MADITHATCNVNNGAISLNIEGGKAPFKYEWSHGNANSEIKDLAAGTYEVQVTDNHGRVLSKSFEVDNESVDLQISSEIKDATCGDQNGSIKVEVAGGEGPYNFEWSTNGRSANLNKLSAGSYDLIVSDQNGCSKKASFEVGLDRQAIKLAITSEITTASCAGKDGQIALTVNGNHGPLKFTWNHGATGPVLGNLDVGKYQVTITDEHGCFMKSDYTVGQATLPDAPIISQLSDSLFVNQKNVQYQWYKDGQAITGANQQVLKIAEGGRYWVEVVNDQSCATASDYFFAEDPYIPLAGNSSIRQVEFYPNPAINDINVRLYLAEPAEAEISIYDFTGRILRTENLGTVYSSATHKLSVQELPAGTYLIRAKADNEIVTRRFIKP